MAHSSIPRRFQRTIAIVFIAANCGLFAVVPCSADDTNQPADAATFSNESLVSAESSDSSKVADGANVSVTASPSYQGKGRSGIPIGIALAFPGLALVYFAWQRHLLRHENDELRRTIELLRSSHRNGEQLERRLSRLQRMESLGALAGGFAHDLNNLLVGVMCNAEMLKNDLVPAATKVECVDGIIHSAEAAADLSQMMLAHTGRQPTRTETIDVGELVAQMMPMLRAASLKHQVVVEPMRGPLYAKADATQIQHVLLNLVRNAADATDDPAASIGIRLGTVTLDDVDSQHFHGQRRDGGTFTFFEVTDSGRGVTDEQLERIFEPFYTDVKYGRGMGLALVYGNVVRHNGLIECRSRVGVGTTMRILLPAEPAPQLTGTETPPTTTFDLSCGHAVVIDDEPSVLLAMERILTSHGWTCEVYEQPKQALAELEDTAKNTDCVVVDVRMPEMDGRAVVEHLLERHPLLPVTVVSGYSVTNLHDFRAFPNVINTLEKPFSTSSVMGSLQQAARMSQA